MRGRSKPAASTYRTTTWRAYSEALWRRGSLLIWFDPEAEGLAVPQGAPEVAMIGRRPFRSEEGQTTIRRIVVPTNAIQACLTLKTLFGLPLRQTQGLVARLIDLAGLDWPA